jgi:hypothetical protein
MGRYTVHLVGEANYQAAIANLSAGDPVTIEHEPDNPHDPRALRCADVTGATIGYIERDSWLARAMIDQKTAIRAGVKAIIGGEKGKPTRGVVLTVLTGADAKPGSRPPASQRSPAPKKQSEGCLKVAVIVMAVFVGLGVLGSVIGPDKTENADGSGTSSSPNTDESEQERRTAGFHCLSGWDGSHRELVSALKDSLRDPDSFEHIETKITPVNDKGEHVLLMRYRARNGFGGMNVGALMATVRNSDCSFQIVQNASQ